MKRKRWDRVFSRNKTHLKIVGLQNLQKSSIGDVFNLRGDPFSLEGVKSLDISYDTHERARDYDTENVVALLIILPELRELDTSNVNMLGEPFRSLRSLTKFVWNGGTAFFLHVDGSNFHFANNIMDLSVDSFATYFVQEEVEKFTAEPVEGEANKYLWMKCPRLERLSMMGATYKEVGHWQTRPISQEMLIKMVRHHPTLRWLRSDLTAENVAMLKEERPHITFVSG